MNLVRTVRAADELPYVYAYTARIALAIAMPIHVHHNGSRTSSGRASAGDYMAGRHLVGHLSLAGPWALSRCFAFAAAPRLVRLGGLHPPTLARSSRQRLSARRLQLGLVPVQSTHASIAESLSLAMGVRPGVLPLVSDPHQRCGTALYCSWPSTSTAAAPAPLNHLLGVCDRRASSVAAPHCAYRLRRLLLLLLLATASTHRSSSCRAPLPYRCDRSHCSAVAIFCRRRLDVL